MHLQQSISFGYCSSMNTSFLSHQSSTSDRQAEQYIMQNNVLLSMSDWCDYDFGVSYFKSLRDLLFTTNCQLLYLYFIYQSNHKNKAILFM